MAPLPVHKNVLRGLGISDNAEMANGLALVHAAVFYVAKRTGGARDTLVTKTARRVIAIFRKYSEKYLSSDRIQFNRNTEFILDLGEFQWATLREFPLDAVDSNEFSGVITTQELDIKAARVFNVFIISPSKREIWLARFANKRMPLCEFVKLSALKMLMGDPSEPSSRNRGKAGSGCDFKPQQPEHGW